MLRGYDVCRTDKPFFDWVGRGVDLLSRSNIYHKNINIVSDLQVIAVRVSLNMEVTVCCIYLPPDSIILCVCTSTDLLLKQLLLKAHKNVYVTQAPSTRLLYTSQANPSQTSQPRYTVQQREI
uniref:Uncharacterized protein n=1 Tax=Timema monikensis TaxID=170555 RepID=A0A7R9ED71_9NEOP|nr:unnamed protein product [Timema monikensis]